MRSIFSQHAQNRLRNTFLFCDPRPEPFSRALTAGLKLALLASAPWALLVLALLRELVGPNPATLGLAIGTAFLAASAGIVLGILPLFDQLSSWSERLGQLAQPAVRPRSSAGDGDAHRTLPGLWQARRDLQGRLLEERRMEQHHADAAGHLARMGHELVTPLNGVLGVADLLESSELPERDLEMIRALRFSVVSLLGIVRDSMQLVDSEGRPLPLELNPERVLREVVNLLTPRATIQQVAIELDGRGLPRRVKLDALRLRRILIHLLAISIRGTREGQVVVRGRLRRTQDEREILRVDIRDTGDGIEPELVNCMLGVEPEPRKAQIEDERCRDFRAASIWVRELGGRIGVESWPRVGSCFWAELPVTSSQRAWSSESSVIDLSETELVELEKVRETFARRLLRERQE